MGALLTVDEYSQGLFKYTEYSPLSLYGSGFIKCQSTGSTDHRVPECSSIFHNVPSVFTWFSVTDHVHSAFACRCYTIETGSWKCFVTLLVD